MLDYFGRDLTKLAAESKLDPVYGRDNEIEQIVQILNKRKKNNPLLVGEPGVGKCFCEDSMVTIKNDLTGDVFEVTIKDFLKTLSHT
jgi:ATP-dependent Clp protease ATP-binding subunit ClpA